MRVGMEDDVRARPVWMLLSQAWWSLGSSACCSRPPGGVRVPVDPLVLGLSLALPVTGARLVWCERRARRHPGSDLEPACGAGVLVLYGVMAVLLVRRVPLPAWAGWRLAGVVGVLLGLAQLLTYPVPAEDWRSLLAVALERRRRGVAGRDRAPAGPDRDDPRGARRGTGPRLEAHVRDDRTLLHEVAGTVAGISAATRLLSVPRGARHSTSAAPRGALVASETARVDRLLADATSGFVQRRDRRRGPRRPASNRSCSPTGSAAGIVGLAPHRRTTSGRERDHLFEVLDLLLDNAARHARSPSSP